MLQQGSYVRNDGAQVTAGVYPRFFVDQVQDMVASEQQGRPIYRDEERVEIIMPGNAQTRFVARVTIEHTGRWPKEYEAFKAGIEISPDGTPLEEWPILKRSQVLELKALGFKTVEHVRDMNDHAIQRVGMGGRALKERAMIFLDDAERIAATTRLSAENERQKDEIASLRAQITQMGQLMEEKFAQLQLLRDKPSDLATMIPGMHDPIAQAQQGVQEEVMPSSLDGLAAPRRRRGGKPEEAAA